MTFFLQLIVTGLAQGMVYALIAIGFVIILKCSEVFNIAQGHFVLIGGYLRLDLSGAAWFTDMGGSAGVNRNGHHDGFADRAADAASDGRATCTGRRHDDYRPRHGIGRTGDSALGCRI